MTKMVSRLSQASHQETNYLRNSLEAFSPNITNFARVIKQIAEKDGEGAAAE